MPWLTSTIALSHNNAKNRRRTSLHFNREPHLPMEKYREKITPVLKRSLVGLHIINDEAGKKTCPTLCVEDGQQDKK